MWRIGAILLLILTGCGGPPVRTQVQEIPQELASELPRKHRQLIVFVPLTDESAGSWLTWFVRYPKLRMVIAVSPRFQSLYKDPKFKTQILLLQKTGRLELALQMPNAPILPLLVDTNSAKTALAPAAEVPDPAYRFPDDVLQLMAQTKAAFFKQWNFSPRGFVLPYGACSPKLLTILDRVGLDWIVAALGIAGRGGPYTHGSLEIWDGSSLNPDAPILVRVWDERQMKETDKRARAIDRWAQEIENKGMEPVLPSDLAAVPLAPIPSGDWGGRTWTGSDWSPWIGDAPKNAGWELLRLAREAIEDYKNSGQASLSRLDMALQELASAQSSSFLAAMGNNDDKAHEFQATLTGVYRLMGKVPPENMESDLLNISAASVRTSSTTARAEKRSDGGEHVMLEDSIGDSPHDPGLDLRSADIFASSATIVWSVVVGSTRTAWIEIYVDINTQPNVGTLALLRNHGLVASPLDAWEYAIVLTGDKALLYRTQSAGTYAVDSTFPVITNGNALSVAVPRSLVRGSPGRWGYQVLVHAVEGGPVYDILDPPAVSQIALLEVVRSGKRSDIPFVRPRSTAR